MDPSSALRDRPSRVLYDRLRDAVETDHPCDYDNACDIAAARRHDLHLYAADQLARATDQCEATAAALALFRGRVSAAQYAALLDEEREALCKVPHVRCEACDGTVWEPDPGSRCGNCGKALPPPPEEADDAP